VRERLKANGEIAVPLDDRSLDRAIAAIRRSGATSVAVCFLHSYLNPAHEIAAVERLARELPDVSISRSSDVLPQIKEYERVSTTIVNAYVRPQVRHYLANLEQRLHEAGFTGSLFIILSHGGMAPVEEASRLAAGTVLSGPAGGISGARRCADLTGIPDLVPFDMGGTSTDISLVSEGRASLSADGSLAISASRYAASTSPASRPAAAIASVDAGGTLRVGPKARARCRGRPATAAGGEAATVCCQCRALSRRQCLHGRRAAARRGSRSRGRPGGGVLVSRLEAAAGIGCQPEKLSTASANGPHAAASIPNSRC
jgi:N-methylhydantoinase A